MPGGAFLPPPYEELGPDGRRYFKLLGVSPHLLRMYELLIQASDLAALRPTRAGKAQALEIDRMILQVKNEVDAAAKQTALEGDALIRKAIERTRVRPPTMGLKNDHTSLLGAVHSRPVRSILPGGGAVGLADIEELDVGTNRPSRSGGASGRSSYWRAQEWGSDHLVGHVVYGIFQPGEAAPSPGASRTHAIFEARGRGEGPRKKMTIQNPIEERAFLREGGWQAYELRRALHKDTEARAISKMQTIAGRGGL